MLLCFLASRSSCPVAPVLARTTSSGGAGTAIFGSSMIGKVLSYLCLRNVWSATRGSWVTCL